MQLLHASGGFVLFGFFVCFNLGKGSQRNVWFFANTQSVLHARQWISDLLGGLSRDSRPLQFSSFFHGHRASHLMGTGTAWQSTLRQCCVLSLSHLLVLNHLLLFFLHSSVKHRQIYSLLLTQGFFGKQYFSPIVNVFCNLWRKAIKEMTKLFSCVSFFGLKYSVTYTETKFCIIIMKVSSSRIWQDASAGTLTN